MHGIDEDTIANHPIAQNFNKEEVRVPRIASPFLAGEGEENILQAVNLATEAGFVPEGYGLIPGERNFCDWKAGGMLNVGRSGSEKILLPKSVWYPRAYRWVLGLYFMTKATKNTL